MCVILEFIFIVAVALLVASPLCAQEFHTPTPNQEELFNSALSKLQEDENVDLEAAEMQLRDALKDGPYNLLYLNLGRSLQRQGRCWEAEEMYSNVADAPVARHTSLAPGDRDGFYPNRENVLKKLSEYRAGFLTSKNCLGRLLIMCTDPTMTLTVDDALWSCGEERPLEPGEYTVVGTVGESNRISMTVTVSSMERQAVRLEPPEPPGSGLATAGWVMLGLGGASLFTGVLFSALLNQTNRDIDDVSDDPVIDPSEADRLIDNAERYETLQWAGYGLGAACVITGATLLFINSSESDPSSPPSSTTWHIAPWADPTAVGLTTGARF